MTADQTEFLISQYADGTIAATDRVALESHLATDPAARRLLDEYRQLDALLRTAAPSVPAFDYDALAARINAAIDDHNTAREPLRLPIPWLRVGAGLAIAASVLLAVGLWLRPFATAPTSSNPTVATNAKPAGVIQVAVLQPADARLEYGPALQQIRVGPPAGGLTDSRVLSEAIVTRPNTLFIAKADVPAQDTPQSLY
jgi:anti-sigma factor RsiW